MSEYEKAMAEEKEMKLVEIYCDGKRTIISNKTEEVDQGLCDFAKEVIKKHDQVEHSEIEKLTNDLENLASEIGKLEDENESLKTQVSGLDKEKKTLESEKASLEEDVSRLEEEKQALQANLDSLGG